MLYSHKCDQCGYVCDIYASASEASATYPCPICATIMTRVYTAPYVATRGHHRDHRINPHTGAEEVCIGNDIDSLRKKCAAAVAERSDYNLPREACDRIVKALS